MRLYNSNYHFRLKIAGILVQDDFFPSSELNELVMCCLQCLRDITKVDAVVTEATLALVHTVLEGLLC